MKHNPRIDFFVIGAQKAGTTSIYKYLSKHPNIYLPIEKEAPFFSDDDKFTRGFSEYYDEFFGYIDPGVLLGTVTPQYMMLPCVPGRIKETCPDAKLIAILRDPIERAYSHYKMAVRVGEEKRTFQEAISGQLKSDYLFAARREPTPSQDFVISGEYGRILEKYLLCFPRKQLLILSMKELADSPVALMSKLFDFLSVEEITPSNVGKRYHSSSISPLMSYLAHLSFNSRLRLIGKLLPRRTRRRLIFWLGLSRDRQSRTFDSSFRLSPRVRANLENLYRRDAATITKIVGKVPYWIRLWDKK